MFNNYPNKFRGSLTGTVRNFARRFWQKSPDHRGTPESPGRTVTLVPEKDAVVWGIAFKVPEEHVVATKAYLDHREKAGYENVSVMFQPDDPNIEPFNVEVYMSIDATSEHHAGPANIDEIANIVIRSHGPSGPNIEYVLRVALILREKGSHVPDEHVFALEKRVLELSKENKLGVEILRKLGYSEMGDLAEAVEK
ncbi:unnamed protein product [Caenorhabditis auriculariae]|uniref:glutathione-specific gamma-glutamylcyclotransferase n=1 Tax=Caenorhabditis auriculariae TaxID=2777116 RepID=A0A8S1GUX1_9PELO|nr:unnamed protein product [Caenorhabditis auriculariae]